MKTSLKNILKSLLITIFTLLFIGLCVRYTEYRSEYAALKIYKANNLDTLSKEEARMWVNYNVGNTSTTKWYLHQMINADSLPDSINFWTESSYLNY